MDRVPQSDVNGQVERALGNRGDQRTWLEFPVGLARRMREHDFASRAKPAVGDAPVEVERRIRRGLGNAGFALEDKRQERIRPRG